ncbi:cytochrome P450 hydroxylase [Mycobacterium gallinarum]|uniref:Cytochrome P450 hydroxylase n=1 Tax=Mycobacterium gallinarum TaxID=39689 RepID=A0A9W4FHV8_9MYCO|nr:cytochrome P450 [Mycobacterium gallinarum]BBY95604.1 cytochrome P450 hydroxylase [Mycobacterium gallinarum]
MTVDVLCPNVFDAGLPTLDYDVKDTPADVYPRIRQAQAQAPIAIGPFGPEIISHELARTMLRDPRFTIPPGMNLMVQGITSGPLWDKIVNSLLGLDGEPHRRLRSLVSKAFTPRASARMHNTIVEVINDLIDHVAAQGRCDVVTDIARPYPVPIICALLGAPREDWQLFSRWADEIFTAFTFNPDGVDEAFVMRAWGELDDYVDEMVARRRHTPTDDLLSALIRAEDEGDRLNAAELRMLAGGLLLAGTDTTRNQLAGSIDALVDHPDQWALLAENPELAANAVEETIRHSPIGSGTLRTVTEDTDFAGHLFPAGTMVIVNTLAANRDPAVYDDPDRFDLTRSGAPAVLTFGGGIHYCLGANLARLELAEALKIVTRRMTNPSRTGPAPWKPMMELSGPTTLPIEFSSA